MSELATCGVAPCKDAASVLFDTTWGKIGLSTDRLNLKFDGPALREHRMDVRALAPALVALSDLFVAAHAEISDGSSLPPALEVQATREGSFGIDLLVQVPDFWEAFRDVFDGSNRDVQSLVNAAGLAVPVVGTMAWLVRRGRVGRERSVSQVAPGELRVTWPDGTSISTSPEAAKLVESSDFRRAARELAAPLGNEGIATLDLTRSSGRRESVSVGRGDLRAFELVEDGDRLVSDSTREVTLRLLNVAFNEGHKWRVHDGLQSFYVTLEDLAFLQRVEANVEVFSRDDRLRCEMRERQWRSASGALRIDRRITKVLEHERGGQQGVLPLDGQDS
jgi:hypothetical protein